MRTRIAGRLYRAARSVKLAFMLALVLLVVSVALADSLNPSTIGPALYLATGGHALRNLAQFTLGVFVVSLAAGLALVAGPGRALLDRIPHPSDRTQSLLLIGLGVFALAAAVVLWVFRGWMSKRLTFGHPKSSGSSFALGAAIMAVELPTAFAYFAVITAVVASGKSLGAQALTILVYNLVFLAPLVAIMIVRLLAGERGEEALLAGGRWLETHAATVLASVVTVLGVAFVVVGVVGLVT
jgi:Sap, sulfolipid-1-addressing protein